MFELPLLVGLGAIVVCFLKGRPVRATVTLLVGAILVVGGVAFTDTARGPGLDIIGVAAFAAAALWAALPPGEPGSPWVRAAAVDEHGRRRIDLEPRSRRRERAVTGALLGLAPAVVYVAVVMAVVEIFDLSGDTAQIGFLGIPFALLGLLAGAVVGFHWVPRGAPPAPEEPAPAPQQGSAVLTGTIAGALVGAAIAVVMNLAGIVAGPALGGVVLVIIGGAVGGLAGRRRARRPAPPETRVGPGP